MHKQYLIVPDVCRLAPQSRLINRDQSLRLAIPHLSPAQFSAAHHTSLAHPHTALRAGRGIKLTHTCGALTDHSLVTSHGVVGLANSCLYQPPAVRVLILFYHITFIAYLLFACNILIQILILFLSKNILINLLDIILYLFPTRLMQITLT